MCGTYEYMAPEIVNQLGHDDKTDIWALGILFYEMLTGKSPYTSKTFAELSLEQKNKHVSIEGNFTNESVDFLI